MTGRPTGSSAGSSAAAARSAAPLVAAVCAVVVAAGLFATLRQVNGLVGDQAVIELRTRDVWSRNPPILGPYSRQGWNHPGPTMYWLLAAPYALLGMSAKALMVSTLLLNTVSVAAIVWLVGRRDPLRAAAAALLVAAVIWATPDPMLIDVWNPSITVLPFLLTTVAAICVANGDQRGLAFVVAPFMFVVTSHIGMGVVLAPIVVTALVVWWRGPDRRPIPRSLFVVVAVVIAPLVIDTAANWPGNLVDTARTLLSSDEPRVGVASGLALVGRATSLWFPFEPRFDQFFGFVRTDQGLGFLPGLLPVLLLLCAVRAHMKTLRLAATLILVGLASASVAVVSIRGELYPYLLYFVFPLIYCGWAVVIAAGVMHAGVAPASVVRSLVTERPRARAMIAGGLAGAALVTVGVASARPFVDRQLAESAEFLAAETKLAIAPGPVIVDTTVGDTFLVLIAGAMFNELDHAGVDFRVLPADALVAGAHRAAPPKSFQTVVIAYETITGAPPPGGRPIAVSDPLTAAERAETDRLTASLTAVLATTEFVGLTPLLSDEKVVGIEVDQLPALLGHEADFARLRDLRTQGPRFVAYLVPPGG